MTQWITGIAFILMVYLIIPASAMDSNTSQAFNDTNSATTQSISIIDQIFGSLGIIIATFIQIALVLIICAVFGFALHGWKRIFKG